MTDSPSTWYPAPSASSSPTPGLTSQEGHAAEHPGSGPFAGGLRGKGLGVISVRVDLRVDRGLPPVESRGLPDGELSVVRETVREKGKGPVMAHPPVGSRCVMTQPLSATQLAQILFTSALQASDEPSPDQVRTAIDDKMSLCALAECYWCVAQEAGDHPDVYTSRMRWALNQVARAYPPIPTAA